MHINWNWTKSHENCRRLSKFQRKENKNTNVYGIDKSIKDKFIHADMRACVPASDCTIEKTYVRMNHVAGSVIDAKIIYSLAQAHTHKMPSSVIQKGEPSERDRESARVRMTSRWADTVCTIYFTIEFEAVFVCRHKETRILYASRQFCLVCSAFCYNSGTSVRFYGLVNELQ